MKRSASNLLIILLLLVVIVGVIVYAADKQLAPSYAPSDGGSGAAGEELPAGAAGLVLSELMVENDGAVRDEDGDYPRWVELYNSTAAELSLDDIRKCTIKPDFGDAAKGGRAKKN